MYRWLDAHYRYLLPALPELTRLLRLLKRCRQYTDAFLAEPAFLTIADTYGIARIHPRREGRSPQHVGKKGTSNGRWIVGVERGWLVPNAGKGVTWPWDTANVSDREVRAMPVAYKSEPITVGDFGFREQDAPHDNRHFCAKGTWSERFTIETDVSWVCQRFNGKQMYQRTSRYIDARLGYLSARMNGLLDVASVPRSLAEFVI